MSAAVIVGVGMSRFGKFVDSSLAELAGVAVDTAVADAGIGPSDVGLAFVASTITAVTTDQAAVVGQVVLSRRGIHGIPVFNVENACAGSSAALNLACQAIAAGSARYVLVVGVEKMFSRDRGAVYRGLNGAADAEWAAGTGVDLTRESVFMRAVYAQRLRDYADRYPLSPDTLASIAVKNRSHAALNEFAQYREPMTVADVLGSRMVEPPITAFMCSPIADGAAAVVVTSAARAIGNLRAVRILGSRVSMGSPPPRSQPTITRVARAAYADAGIEPADVDVAEVHDATAFSELLAYQELGFCEPGKGAALVESGATALGGTCPVNPSGGLESRGHPLAATGAAQILELTTQLRGEAGARQVPGARVGLAETAGGFVDGDSAAVAVTILAGAVG